jgi:hypothetical protein
MSRFLRGIEGEFPESWSALPLFNDKPYKNAKSSNPFPGKSIIQRVQCDEVPEISRVLTRKGVCDIAYPPAAWQIQLFKVIGVRELQIALNEGDERVTDDSEAYLALHDLATRLRELPQIHVETAVAGYHKKGQKVEVELTKTETLKGVFVEVTQPIVTMLHDLGVKDLEDFLEKNPTLPILDPERWIPTVTIGRNHVLDRLYLLNPWKGTPVVVMPPSYDTPHLQSAY